jgi:hypothetical protein
MGINSAFTGLNHHQGDNYKGYNNNNNNINNNSLQQTAVLDTSHIIWKVLQSET